MKDRNRVRVGGVAVEGVGPGAGGKSGAGGNEPAGATRRRRALAVTASAVLGLAVGVGCGSRPLPQIATEGSTIVLAIPQNLPLGFGRAFAGNPAAGEPPYDPESKLEDPQRGELVFELVDAFGDPPTGPGGPQVFLPLRLLTQVFPHAGYPLSIAPGSLASFMAEGQPVALLDIPVDAVPATGDYFVEVRRYRRDPLNRDDFVFVPSVTSLGEPWLGWGREAASPSSPESIPIRILEGDGVDRTTPANGWVDIAGVGLSFGDFGNNLDLLTPLPDFEVSVTQAADPGPPPAAWEVEISYPREVVRVATVTSDSTTPGSAIVSWTADQATSVACGAPPDTLRVQVADPSRRTRTVRVSFELVNYDAGCGRRVEATDFSPVPGTFRAYDESGVEATSTWQVRIPVSATFR